MVFLLIERNVNKHFWEVQDLKTNKIIKVTNNYKEALRFVKEVQATESIKHMLA